MAKTLLDAYAFALEGYGYVCRVSYASTLYPDHTAFHHWRQKEENDVIALPVIEGLRPEQINDDAITFKTREKRRASKVHATDDDTPIQELLDEGVRLHRLMELVDWNTRDVSFITNEKDRELVEAIVSLPVFDVSKDARFFPEYGYYDEDLKTTGFIDLLMVDNGVYSIIDWKTRNIDDLAYVDQLHAYQRNIERIFNIPSSKIKLYLASLLEKRVREIETLDD